MDPGSLFLFILVVIVGLCFGSFATALTYRIPRGLSWIYDPKSVTNKAGRSQCPSCSATLTARDLVPLFSWLCSRGRCRHCSQKISPRYPLIELATMLAVLAQYYAWGATPMAIPVLLAVPFLIAAVLIDWEHMILPDDANIALTLFSVIFVGALSRQSGWDTDIILDHLIAAVLLAGLFWFVAFIVSKIKGRDALGRGDLKFLPAVGLFLGTAPIPAFLALSGLLGLLTAFLKRKGAKKMHFLSGLPSYFLCIFTFF